MGNWFNQLSKPTLVLGALILGTLFIVLSDPPRTICDAQLENFKETKKSFLFDEGTGEQKKKAKLRVLKDLCLKTNTIGGCLEYFHGLRKILLEIEGVYPECRRQLLEIKTQPDEIISSHQVEGYLWKGVELLVMMGWGEAPPEGLGDKYGWLEAYDMNLYCKMRDKLIFNSGKEKWKSFKLKALTLLPGTEGMPRREILQRSILSDNCNRFR